MTGTLELRVAVTVYLISAFSEAVVRVNRRQHTRRGRHGNAVVAISIVPGVTLETAITIKVYCCGARTLLEVFFKDINFVGRSEAETP